MVRRLREALNRHSTELDAAEDLAESALSDYMAQSTPAFASEGRRAKSGQGDPSSSSFFGRDLEDISDLGDVEAEIDSVVHHDFGRTRLGRRSFQEFLKMIEEEKNLFELKRVRNDITIQIVKKKAQIRMLFSDVASGCGLIRAIGDRVPEEVIDGEKVEDVNVYVNRLTVAKKRVDKRIATMSGEHPSEKVIAGT